MREIPGRAQMREIFLQTLLGLDVDLPLLLQGVKRLAQLRVGVAEDLHLTDVTVRALTRGTTVVAIGLRPLAIVNRYRMRVLLGAQAGPNASAVGRRDRRQRLSHVVLELVQLLLKTLV